jgi:DNA-binding NarL/FixJ family response regulator
MAVAATIQVLVCDDHALVRSGLCRMLESEATF